MPFNGSGSFVSVGLPNYPAIAGQPIYASQFNANMTDIFTGFTNCMTRDGQSPPSANIPMNSKKLTGLAAGTASGDALSFAQSMVSDSLSQLLWKLSTTAGITGPIIVDQAAARKVELFYNGSAGATTYGVAAGHAGLNTPAAVSFNISTADTLRATFDISGNFFLAAAGGSIGIGRAPSYKLDSLAGATGAKMFRFSATGGSDLFGYSDASGSGITNSDPYTGGAMFFLTGTVADVFAPGGMGLFGGANSAITNIGANITVLDIVGKSTTRAGGINLRSSDNSLSGYWYFADGSGAIGTRSASSFTINTSDTARMSFAAASADITAQGVALTRVKTATTSRNTTTVLADDPHLLVPLSAGTWNFELWVPVWATAASTGLFKFGMAFSGTQTNIGWSSIQTQNGAYAGIATLVITAGSMSFSAFAVAASLSGADQLKVTGTITVTVAGNLSFQWAQAVSNANAANAGIGAWMTCVKVA
jgi:hypothetical protein